MNRRNGGFSMTEMLFTCLILSLTGGLILQTLNLAIRQVRARSADSAAEILCNELAVVVRDQLSYATGVEGADSASDEIAYPAFTSGANGLNGVKCEITALDENGIDTGRVRFRYTKDGQSFDFFPLGDTSGHLKWLTPKEVVKYSYKPGKNVFQVTVTVTDADGYSEEAHKREFDVKPVRNIMLKPNTAPVITNKYVIVWRNSKDGTILKAESLAEGASISFGQADPTYSDAQSEYRFTGWLPPLAADATVTGDQTYWAQFEPVSPKTYTVKWDVNGTVVETDADMEYGATPEYNGPAPTKPSDTEHDYAFSGWIPNLETVKRDITYTANFTPELKKYVITWKKALPSGGLETLGTSEAEHGSIPAYPGGVPTWEPSADYVYEFSGWSPALASVTGPQTYTAQFTRYNASYDITWTTEDGTVLKTDTFDYGATPSYGDGAPTKASDAEFDYQLKWDPPLHSVNGPETYRATFDNIRRKYTVKWYDHNGAYLAQILEAEYGAEISYNGSELTQYVGADEKTYVFSGWDPPMSEGKWTVTGDQTFTAKYVLQTGSGA